VCKILAPGICVVTKVPSISTTNPLQGLLCTMKMGLVGLISLQNILFAVGCDGVFSDGNGFLGGVYSTK